MIESNSISSGNENKKRKAVFLDRDGTINEDVGYFCSLDQFHLIPRTIDALRLLQETYVLFIVTNQSGVAKKVFSESDLIKFNWKIQDILMGKGIRIRKTYYCPHLPEEKCLCHKPSDFFLRHAEKKFCLDLEKSVVIGDHPHDIEMAKRVGAASAYVLTGHGEKHRPELKVVSHPDVIAKDIYEAARWIMKEGNNKKEVRTND